MSESTVEREHDGAGAIADMPILMFCIAFGLSMDYEVFLLSRIKEEFDRTGDNRASVALGLERTGRIVSAAAALLAITFVAFGTADVSFIKAFGLGLALAVLMDATVIRGLLVPAFMRLAGRANWWAPAPLRRIHDRYGISEASGPAQPAAVVTPVAIGVHRVLDLFDATCAKEPPDDSDPAGTTIGDHDHDTDNIGIITAGELILIISGEEHRYGPGAWYHVSPGQTHAARSRPTPPRSSSGSHPEPPTRRDHPRRGVAASRAGRSATMTRHGPSRPSAVPTKQAQRR